ncbi:MAG: gamma-glutamyltransferase [Actinomycetota bacterium]|nr:gamma-glutamyltransferase [Actinomycetota bacterium]
MVHIGHAILDSGGNAFDAFVAMVAAENVVAEGASSLAGPLSAVLHDGSNGEVVYFDADFNDPLSPDWRWHATMPRDGRSVLVPGAPAGLAALAETRGTRPLHQLLEPAIRLATEGFAVSRLMANFITWRAPVLQRTPYGRKTYFSSDGAPLTTGTTLRLPEVASFLSKLGQLGPSYVYAGDWGARFLESVRADKGVLTEADLATYEVYSRKAWTTTYRGYTFHSSSGRCYGGPWTLLALKTLEHMSLPASPHYSEDADLLQVLIEIARAVWSESWLLDYRQLDDLDAMAARLTEAHSREIWDRVRARVPLRPAVTGGSHSYHIIVVDESGNAVSGTTTIQSDPWGEGVFVEGVPLTTAGAVPWSTAPGSRRLAPYSIHLAFRDGLLRFSAGGISNSAVEAAFQFLVNLIDHGLPVEESVSRPRFGTFPDTRRLTLRKNWIDPRVDSAIVRTLRRRGLRFQRRGLLDTGLGTVVAALADGRLAGASAPIPYIPDPTSTVPA